MRHRSNPITGRLFFVNGVLELVLSFLLEVVELESAQ